MLEVIEVTGLGQAGLRIQLGRSAVYLDPYLSDSVEALAGPGARRFRRPPLDPQDITDADWVLVTHSHIDHCDPDTLGPLSRYSPGAFFMAPSECHPILESSGIRRERMRYPSLTWEKLNPDLEVMSVPACHPDLERTPDGRFRCVGYLLRYQDRLLYHAGDTCVCEELIQAVRQAGCPDWAFLPVNEANYYLSRAGIVGNMSPREAFAFADEIGVKEMIPIHWDLFPANSIPEKEIEWVYRLEPRRHVLRFIRSGTTVRLHPAAID